MKLLKIFALISIFSLSLNLSVSAEQNGSISGQVLDTLGAAVPGATVTAINVGNQEKSVTTNRQGEFVIKNVAPGKYTLRVTAPKFGLYENKEVDVKAGENYPLVIALAVDAIRAEVLIENNQFNVSSVFNSTILTQKDIENLPDNPEQFKAALRNIAGAFFDEDEDEDGGITVDGFSANGALPSKQSIREVRINRSSFSAEYERMGSSGIEILTRPGSDTMYRSQGFFNFNDARLNSRSPFALNRAPSQSRLFGTSFSGPLQKGRSSFFLDFSRGQLAESRVVNASILDSSYKVVPFRQDISTPNKNFSFSTRGDYQINKFNTLTARYSLNKNSSENQGVSDFSLAEPRF
jgi:hypothetical protein